MRRTIEKIEIQEPPIEELKKKSSCAKRSCFTGCGCIVIFVIASLILLKYASGPRTKELKEVPGDFPSSIPIYDQDNIVRMEFTSGAQNSKTREIAAFVPKLILSPVLIIFDQKNGARQELTWENFKKFMAENSIDDRDLFSIQWADLNAEPKFIFEYYNDELNKNGFAIDITTNNDKIKQFTFEKDDLQGVFYISDNTDKKGTDYFSIDLKKPKN